MDRITHNFEIIAEIGRGGMGVVYKAQQKQPRRIVALKILQHERISRRQMQRFLREMQLCARLEHPHIVKVYAAVIDNPRPFVAMQYIEGCTLWDYMQKANIARPVLLKIIATVADALQYTHNKGIIHRDIKPSNILLDTKGIPYISDFGLARTTKVEDRSLTRTGEIMGTPHYMSPEQALENPRAIDHRSDIYSLGAILYEATTGRNAIPGDSHIAILFNLVNGEIPIEPHRLRPDIATDLETIILTAIARDKRDRYQYASYLAQDLQNFVEKKAIMAKNISPFRRLWRRCRRNFQTQVAAIMLGIMLIAAFCFFGWRQIFPSSLDSPIIQYQKAHQAFSRKQYKVALQFVEKISSPNKKLLKLKADILKKLRQFERMRLVLVRISEKSKTAQELQQLGKKALAQGYFQDADKYFSQALEARGPINRQQLQKYQAQSWLYQGDFLKAEEQYRRIESQDANVYIGLATIYYHQQNYPRASEYLNKINACSKLITVQKLLLDACLLWQDQRQNLGRWHWLSSVKCSCTSCREVANILTKEIGDKLRLAKFALAKCPENVLRKNLYRKITLHLQALKLETAKDCNPASVCQNFAKQVAREALYPQSKIFFTEVLLRYLIRHRLWPKAHELANRGEIEYPWSPYLYMLRAIVKFHCNDLQGVGADTLAVLRLERWHFIALENMTALFLQRFTHEEFQQCFSTFIRYLHKPIPDFQQSIMDLYLKKLAATSLYRFYAKRKYKHKEQWLSILQTLLTNKSPKIRQTAIAIVVAHRDNSQLQQLLTKLYRQYPSTTAPGRVLETLKLAIAQREQRQLLGEMQQLLLRYGTLCDKRYARKVFKNKKNCLPLLFKILRNDTHVPLMRLLAAQMIMAMNARKYVQQLRQIDTYPANLLAMVAIRSADIGGALPNIKISQVHNRFYKILLALHINPRVDSKLYHTWGEKLLYDESELVSLCATYNFRRYQNLQAPISNDKVKERLFSLAQKGSNHIRALALRLLFKLDDLVQNSQNYTIRHANLRLIAQSIWNAPPYQQLLLESLNASKELQLAALQSIITDRRLRGYINTTSKAKSEWHQQLQDTIHERYLQTNSYVIKYWSAVALATLDKYSIAWDIVKNPEVSTMVRYGVVLQIVLMEHGDTSLFTKFLSAFRHHLQTSDQPRFSQLLIFGGGKFCAFASTTMLRQNRNKYWSYYSQFRSVIKQNILLGFKNLNSPVRWATIAALLWVGDGDDIPRIYPFLESPNIHIRRAAAATLASLTLEYQYKKIDALQEKFRSCSKVVKKAAAVGYQEFVHKNIYYPYPLIAGLDFDSGYQAYLHYFRFELRNKALRVKLPMWIKALQYAGELEQDPKYFYEAALMLYEMELLPQSVTSLHNALRFLQERRQIASNDWLRCQLLLAKIAKHHREYQQAIRIVKKTIAQFPLEAEPHFYMGAIMAKCGKKLQAQKHYWRAYVANPLNPSALLALSQLHIKNGDYASALKLVEYSSPIWTTLHTPSVRFGILRERMHKASEKNQQKQTCCLLLEMLEEAPHKASYHHLLATVLWNMGHKDKANQYLCNAYLCNPYYSGPLYDLANNLLVDKQVEQAIIVLTEIQQRFCIPKRELLQDLRFANLKKYPWANALPD